MNLYELIVCIIAGLGAGLGTGFAGMSAANVISPMLIAFLGIEPYASVWVYRNQDEFAKQSYGICVDRFDLAKSDDLLSSMFA